MDPVEPLVIERAGADDIDEIMFLDRHCFAATWSREQWINELVGSPHTHPIVARLDGRTVGFASITCIELQAHIPTLCVAETHRGVGLGSLLLEALLDHARAGGVAEVYLEVRSRNTGARRLYERYGFEVIELRRNYYTLPEDDGVVMRCNLRGPAAEPSEQDRLP